ncbi:MAG: BspA family leucine-rich repeat surface protein [Clostridiales bacterium]|nr:BspA family leucine-rich repeat surface protein [Clostridiales bacterium]
MNSTLPRKALSLFIAIFICAGTLLSVCTPVEAATYPTLKTGFDVCNDFKTMAGAITNVKTFQRSSTLSNSATLYDISENGDGSIYAWCTGTGYNRNIYWYSASEKIYLNPNSAQMFEGASSLVTCNLSGLDSSKVTNMFQMFCKCKKLTSLDVTAFDTHNVTNMNGMFSNCAVLATLDVSGFNTSKVTNMGAMFNSCAALVPTGVESFNTGKVENFANMFNGCKKITELDLSGYNTSSATGMASMFYGCSGLVTLTFGRGFDTSRVATFTGMFGACNALTTIYASKNFVVDGEDTGSLDDVPSSSIWTAFNGCRSLKGGAGSMISSDDQSTQTIAYARFDGGPSKPGYFTQKSSTTHNFAEPAYTPYFDYQHPENSYVLGVTMCLDPNCPNMVDGEPYVVTGRAEIYRYEAVNGQYQSCDEDGYYDIYFDAFDVDGFNDHLEYRNEKFPALGHLWGETQFIEDVKTGKVTATAVCERDSDHIAAETVNMAYTSMSNPTCTTPGVNEYVATFTQEPFAGVTHTGQVTVPALGHNWGEAEYEWIDNYTKCKATHICSRCNKEETETVDASITEQNVPDCNHGGYVTYTSNAFSNPAFSVQTETITLSPLSHFYVTREENRHEATCTQTGSYDLVTRCQICGLIDNSEHHTIPKKPHDWNTTNINDDRDVSWSANNSAATLTLYCKNCQTPTAIAASNISSEVLQGGSCEAPGTIRYTATFTNSEIGTIIKTKTVASTALGHNWGEVDYKWSADNLSCTATRVCSRCNKTETETKAADITSTAQTCTEPGTTTYTVTFENAVFGTQTKTVSGEAGAGHLWGAVTYTWSADNKKCTATRVCSRCNTPDTQTVNAVITVSRQATCEVKGEHTYTATFTNPAFETQTKKFEDIQALGHTWGAPSYDWSTDNLTCTATRVCSRCNKTETENGKITVSSSAQTCTEAGVTTYTATFTNSAFTTQTKTDTNAASGHLWGEVTYSWSSDNKRCTATRVCSRDASHKETETVNTTSAVTRQATCEQKGVTTYTASFSNSAFATQTKPVENIPALGHNWKAPTYLWNADHSVCTATRLCSRCNKTETENGTITSTTTAATCEEAGVITYTATFKNNAFTKQTDPVTITPTGHTWSDPSYQWLPSDGKALATRYCTKCRKTYMEYSNGVTENVVKQPTCTEKGKRTYTCTFNSSFFGPWTSDPQEDMSALGHIAGSPHQENYEAPGCETAGHYDVVVSCTRCYSVLSSTRQTVKATGHDWGVTTYSWASDYKNCTAERVCRNDESHVRTETKSSTSSKTKDATCTQNGEHTYSVTFNDTLLGSDTKVVPDINALGHDWNETQYVWSEDHSQVTASRVCKRDASHVEEETVGATLISTSAATCDTPGTKVFRSNAFTNTAFKVQTESVDIPTLPHTAGAPVRQNEKAASCTESGSYDEVVYCTKCHAEMSRVKKTIPATGHTPGNPEQVEVHPATYNSDGYYITVTRCTVCDAELSRDRVTIPARKHNYTNITYSWSTDKKTCTAHADCSECTGLTETVESTYRVTKAATCKEAGTGVYTATFTNDIFDTQTESVTIPKTNNHTEGWTEERNRVEPTCETKGQVEIHVICSVCGEEIESGMEYFNPLGHDYYAPTYEWSSDNSKVTARRVCKHNDSHVQTETVNATGKVTKAATCTEDGQRTFTSASFTNTAFAVQTKNVKIDATGHNSGAAVRENVVDATCAKAGSYDEVCCCTVCGKELSRVPKTIAKLAHTPGEPKRENNHDATYNADGYYDNVVYCTVCDDVISTDRIVIPAKRHNYSEPKYSWNSDNSAVTAHVNCDECDGLTQVVSTSNKVTEEETCETDGIRTYTATFTNDVFKTQTKDVAIPALGHDWSAWKVTKAATEAEDGVETRTCSRCDKAETRAVPKLTPKPTAAPTATAKPTAKPTAVPTATTKPVATATPKPVAEPTAVPTSAASNVTLTLNKKTDNIVCGKSDSLKATLKGATGNVTWKSSNTKIATVDSSGKVSAKMAGLVTVTATAAGQTAECKVQVLYKDVTNTKDFWYAPTYYLTNINVVKGYDKQTNFKPANECTRAQMVTFIWRLMGEPAPKTKTCKFSDVKKKDYFYKACLWGNENHIVEGYKDGTFGPQIVCARKHAVTFLWRLAGQPAPKTTKNKFSDIKKSDYFYKAVLWASEKGIVAGYTDGTFRPNGDCLRRQMVTFLYKYDKFVNGRG